MIDQPDRKVSDILEQALACAKSRGAEAAEAVIVEGTSLSASCRLGKLEDIDRSEGRDLGLRIFVNGAQASVSSTDFSRSAIAEAAERCIAMARSAPPDPYCGLADESDLTATIADLDIVDDIELSGERLRDLALETEAEALAIEGITNSLGAGASAGSGGLMLATSGGFMGGYRNSVFSLSCAVLAGEGTAMERDYDHASAVHFADLKSAREIGRGAGERTIRRLNPKKVETQNVPVVYDPRVSASLLRHFAGAISGAAVARGTSFLKDHMGKALFADDVTITDDPRRPRGHNSRPFDGEGVGNEALRLIENGVLRAWLLSTSSARQLGLRTNGRAARSIGAPPSPGATNLYMENGTLSPDELMADIKAGFYVCDLIGMGVNSTTGDYSRGASGFWIENGEITHAVSEVTVAGNLKDMYRRLTPANDLEFRFGTNAPTVRIEGMTVAGK